MAVLQMAVLQQGPATANRDDAVQASRLASSEYLVKAVAQLSRHETLRKNHADQWRSTFVTQNCCFGSGPGGRCRSARRGVLVAGDARLPARSLDVAVQDRAGPFACRTLDEAAETGGGHVVTSDAGHGWGP